MYKIYIDPGHNYSGSDTGAVGFGLKEQDVTVEIAQKLRPMLVQTGFEVKMSRESIYDSVGGSGVSASLAARWNAANSMDADIFVSIHCNAANTKAYGCETYCVSLGGDAERLAHAIQEHLVAETGLYDRGVKTANFAVIKNTVMPAVLVETAFIDNYDDNLYLASDAGKQSIALAIYKGICDYFGREYDLKYNSESEDDLMSTEYEELKAKDEAQDKIINEIGTDIVRSSEDIAEIKAQLVRYDYIDENMPEWARDTITKLVDKGYLRGDDEGKLGLTCDLMRLLVTNDRAGIYGE